MVSTWDNECTAHDNALRVRTLSNKTTQLGYQCKKCGTWKAVRRASIDFREIALAEPFDEGLRDHWYKANAERAQKARDNDRQVKNQEWWEWYSDYLQSEEWKSKRLRVLERDKGLCQACQTRRATEVHHLTYDHVGREPLFDLVSICDVCHRALTHLDRERRIFFQGTKT